MAAVAVVEAVSARVALQLSSKRFSVSLATTLCVGEVGELMTRENSFKNNYKAPSAGERRDEKKRQSTNEAIFTETVESVKDESHCA